MIVWSRKFSALNNEKKFELIFSYVHKEIDGSRIEGRDLYANNLA